jgi:excisionase family DNA binding protein
MSTAKLLSIEEAAEYLGVPVRVLRGLRERRLVPVVHLGKRLYFRAEDLDKLIEPRLEPAMRGPLAPAGAFNLRRVRRPA